ncbi:hypothetical protein BX589_102184 [Paraburkholderia fungorum]|jgi:hypothetical protein|uniref:hypothetical protein n=1 Tax=Paraburkholderia fungorum TaxID=134537 RepID=UPI000D07FB23|nr:hypothetical protein [Paraburkholderia fungorum]PRZ55983.1 hypothetical protein BX589_102184 [Paraburkholderia fungorum]
MSGLDTSSFVVFDVSAFPIVTVNTDAMVTGYGARWTSEMDALIALGKPFAIVYRGAISNESAEDYAQRGQWLVRNRVVMARLCRVLVVVEPDEILREQVRLRGRGIAKAFGVPHRVVATMEDAADILFYRIRDADSPVTPWV